MKIFITVLCAVVLGGLLLGQTPAPASKATVALYTAKCAACHGPDGHADVTAGKLLGAHDFHSAVVQAKSDEDLTAEVGQGKAKMPAFAKQLTPAQIRDLVSYVRQLGQK